MFKINKHTFNNYIFSIKFSICFDLSFIIIEFSTKPSRDPDLSREQRLVATAAVRTDGSSHQESHTKNLHESLRQNSVYFMEVLGSGGGCRGRMSGAAVGGGGRGAEVGGMLHRILCRV